jgi:DNA sulfur modification protein DndB
MSGDQMPRGEATPDLSGSWTVPALQATTGDWVYYAAVLTFGDVAERVGFAKVVHGENRDLNELIQRDLEDRSGDIADYLIYQKKERFFNSLVIGLYDGVPDWYYTSLNTKELLDENTIPDYGRHALGLLVFDGSEKLFALDGQHRLAGIQQAIKRSPSLAKELVTVLFVPHSNTKTGLERTRRLFTTLNRYAKRVATARLIVLDEDDAVAILTRRLIAEHPLFLNKTSIKSPKSIPVSDKKSVTSIGALYDANDVYLSAAYAKIASTVGKKPWKQLKRERPDDDELERMYSSLSQVWTRIAAAVPALHSTLSGPPNTPGTYRRKTDGGDIWLRPIGTMLLLDALVALCSTGVAETQAVKRLASLPPILDQPPWNGLLWDSSSHVMITRAENRRVATALAVHLCGGDIASVKFSKAELERRWTGLFGGRVQRLSSLRSMVWRPKK